MKIRTRRLEMPLQHTFRIARHATEVQRSLIVEVESDGEIGLGESTVDSFYGHSLDSMEASVRSCQDLIEGYRFGSPEALWDALADRLRGDRFALSAIDQAIHDLNGKLRGMTTRAALGLDNASDVCSSYTIGIDQLDVMVGKLQERPGWPVYKIKLGTDQDVEIVRQLRDETAVPFRVDANCGWGVEEAINNSVQLAALGVEFIEQPLPPDSDGDDHRRVFEGSVLPVIADESCQVEADVQACHGRFHGINVKLCKCGGLTPALRMLRRAREFGMQTMIGCMVESSIGISAAAQLLPLLDHADLDGAELLAEDPAVGVSVQRGHVRFDSRSGNGARFRQAGGD